MLKATKTLAAVALVATLGVGLSANTAFAGSQSTSNGEHSSSMGKAVSDTWITTKVKTELAATKGVDSTDVSVTTVDGKVTLTGDLPSKLQVKKTVSVAKSVDGVKDVDDSGLKVKGDKD